MNELEVFGDEILDWDDLDTADASVDDTLHIDWENECYLPALDGSGPVRAIPIYGSTAAWIRRQEDQRRLDVADAICQPVVIGNADPVPSAGSLIFWACHSSSARKTR